MKNATKTRSIIEVEYLRKNILMKKMREPENEFFESCFISRDMILDIASIIGKTMKTIRTWIKSYEKEQRIQVLKDKPRHGKPGNLTKGEEKELEDIIRNKTPLIMGYDWRIWDIKTVNDFVNDQYNRVVA